jgi:hypothetical protein
MAGFEEIMRQKPQRGNTPEAYKSGSQQRYPVISKYCDGNRNKIQCANISCYDHYGEVQSEYKLLATNFTVTI